jgi:thiol-disulfide isomerase/thioredoxin
MNRQISLFVVIAVLFTAIGAYFSWKHLQPTIPANPVVAALFSKTLPDAQNKPQALSQWQGKIVLVNFWATWCPPCVAEMPELVDLQAEQAKNNLQIIGIGIDSASNIQQFSAKYKITYPLLVDGLDGSELSRQFGNQAGGLPFTVLISADGQVKKLYLGRLNMEQVRADLQSL